MVTKLSELPLAHQPGEVWEYSVAPDVLGRVIKVVSGLDSTALIAEKITQAAWYHADRFTATSRSGRAAEPEAARRQPPPTLPDVTAAAVLRRRRVSVVRRDYPHLCRRCCIPAQYHGARLLAPHTVALMTSDPKPGIGYS